MGWPKSLFGLSCNPINNYLKTLPFHLSVVILAYTQDGTVEGHGFSVWVHHFCEQINTVTLSVAFPVLGREHFLSTLLGPVSGLTIQMK